ncbi:histone-like nucleoid-structuring protein Lsr2 [Gordonia aichiensis]|uniref:Putative LSR2-like protein n=1 Tax=Gordonia aichiensis NBRC 108223 TaxID=1220583 RepID=L7KH67_9ACTN|nr:Lsr2 family protein [Gordonia aichiensis]GAC47033.1 putative LSR2-like protein [Gordonia aichiensis NBRC 108223]
MATIRSVAFVDDLDGREIDLDDVHTVLWSWLGVEYQLDISSANLDKVENGRVTVAKLLEASTRVGGRKQSTAPRVSKRAAAAASPKGGTASTGDIREWAIEEGYEVGPRGRLPKEIIEAYEAAH